MRVATNAEDGFDKLRAVSNEGFFERLMLVLVTRYSPLRVLGAFPVGEIDGVR